MITDLNKIFELWKDKVGSKRTPNPTNAEHQYQLREILNDLNWDNEVINELLYNLSEGRVRAWNTGTTSKPEGFWTSVSPETLKNNPQYSETGPDGEAPPEDGTTTKKKKKKKKTTKKPPYEPDFENDSEEEIAEKIGGGDFEETSPEKAEEDLTENRKLALTRKRKGKGGGTTTQREELATISREMALKHPKDSPEKHKKRVLKYIRKLYAPDKKSAEKVIAQINKPKKADNIIDRTLSGRSAANLLRDPKNGFDMAPVQPNPYPLNVTFTGEGTQTIQNVLITKLKK